MEIKTHVLDTPSEEQQRKDEMRLRAITYLALALDDLARDCFQGASSWIAKVVVIVGKLEAME